MEDRKARGRLAGAPDAVAFRSLHHGRLNLTVVTIAWPHSAPDMPGAVSEHPALAHFPHAGSAATVINKIPLRQFHLQLISAESRAGQAARAFIEQRYHELFGAVAGMRYPSLLVLCDGRGHVAAALGIRRAVSGPLFLEHYLDATAEHAIGAVTGRTVDRAGIVELGGFAARTSWAATYLIAAMAAYMEKQGFHHALVTSTGRLRRLFAHFDFDLRSLGEARRDALPDGGRSWGHYYDDTPRVLAGSVTQCFAAVLQGRDRQHHAGRRRIIDSLIAEARELPSC